MSSRHQSLIPNNCLSRWIICSLVSWMVWPKAVVVVHWLHRSSDDCLIRWMYIPRRQELFLSTGKFHMTHKTIQPKSREKFLEILANCTRATGSRTVRYIHSPADLSWPGPQGGQAVRYTHSPTELSWPGPQGRGQCDTFTLPLIYHDSGHGEDRLRYTHSPTELSGPGPRRGQTVRLIHCPTDLLWPRLWGGLTVGYIVVSLTFV